jgi:son of sevenless
MLCRALYDYRAQVASELSLREGEIIEILGQEPSGWWDGLLQRDELEVPIRCWFPSNYVALITKPESEDNTVLSQAGPRSENTYVSSSTIGMSTTMMVGGEQVAIPEDTESPRRRIADSAFPSNH